MQREIPDRIKSAVESKTKDGKLTCRDALAIAERMDVTPRMIGKAADRLGIKIVNCQLGCFT